MSQTDSPTATLKSDENIFLGGAAVSGGWREGVLVLAMVLAPVALTIIILAISVFALVGWQAARGLPAQIPTTASLQRYGLWSFVVASWINLAAVWFWSSRRGLRRDVFAFRSLTWPAVTAGVVGAVIAIYGAPIATYCLSHLTGGRGPEVRINFHDTRSVAIYVLLFVITAPISEEILYRGLLVAWLRRVGWGDSLIWLMGSLIFGANHWIPLGFVWAVAMVGLGALLYLIRLRYDSLTPGLLAHFLFNAHPFLIYPLVGLVPTWLPGHLS